MIALLIIADDFTGALDTGVQFAAAGAVVRVVTDIWYDYRLADEEVQVLVMDAETRHLDSREAYGVVRSITKRAIDSAIPHIYKKTDSALRGNIGSELTALLDASGQEILPFLPAFPRMGRTTREGVHYIDSVPVEDSVFGKDPFEPVICSFIPDIIHLQSSIPVEIVKENEDDEAVKANKGNEAVKENGYGAKPSEKCAKIIIYDAQSQEGLAKAASGLYGKGRLSIMAGCAGFASVLPKLLGLGGKEPYIPQFMPGFLVVCGSVNPITRRQLAYAEDHGFTRIRLTPRQKLDRNYWETGEGRSVLDRWMLQCRMERCCILDSNDPEGSQETMDYAREHEIVLEEVRTGIAGTMGFVLKNLVDRGLKSTLLITGGDTLLGFMNQVGVCEMEPVCEMAPGTVLSRFKIEGNLYQAISKSGGFGPEELLVQLADMILDKKERALC